MATVQEATTRVFVKGLPRSLTTKQLASHFGKQFKVTDAHVFPERCIGFIGFNHSDDAQAAVKYFNRSFIRMSRISVDLARPVEVKRDASGQALPVSKRKTPHPTKLRHEQESNKPEETILKKRKRQELDDGEEERSKNSAESSSATSRPQQQPASEQAISVDQNQAASEAASNSAVTGSDNDWLRGKTSRLLDLVGLDEVSVPDPAREEPLEVEDEEANQPQSAADSANTDEVEQDTVQVVSNGRLFIRNLAFDVTDADLEDRFAQFGKMQEAHVVTDTRKSTSKGLAFIQYSEPEAAQNALKALDGVSFHGRLLHILPASDKREQGLTDFDISKMPLKKQKALKRKMDAGNATFSWNSLYMNPDAVVSSIADRLGVSKSDILDPTSADAAVKQAHAETQLIAETKEFLRNQGVSVDAFQNKQRDDRTILLKNFPFGTSEKDLRDLLEPHGELTRFIFPPAGTMALAQFVEPYPATQALKQLAYKNIKGSVLYLEKAPRGLLDPNYIPSTTSTKQADAEVHNVTDNSSATLFVRNLNFSTSTERLTELFRPLPGFLSARVKTRTDPKRPGEILSMGFGFVEFGNGSSAAAAVSTLNGYHLDGHQLSVQLSTKSMDLGEERRKTDIAKKNEANRTKIIIKNLPFQTSKKDVRSLFAPYGQLKTVRVPKKFDNTSRGFGFAEFVTAKEAQNAMDALSNTHLLGRRLVLEFTEEEIIDPEEQIQAMERKMEQQNDRIQLNKLMGTGRKKFVVGAGEDEQL